LSLQKYELDRQKLIRSLAGLGPNPASAASTIVLRLSASPRRFVVSADVLVLIILLHSCLIGVNISGILDHSLWLREACILLSVTTRTPIIRFATPLLVTPEELP
jgi:hypothetical protein